MKIALLALAAGLVLASPAHAGWKIERAKAIAAIVWQHPCDVRVVWVPIVAGRAEADVPSCTVRFSTAERSEWPAFCTTMIHEYGHLAGYRDPLNLAEPWHSHDPSSVMHAHEVVVEARGTVNGRRQPARWFGVDSRCAKRGRPYLERHGLL